VTATTASPALEALARDVRLYVFGQAAELGRVPQAPQIAAALGRPQVEVQDALKLLAAGRVLVLASGEATIWAASPFCAVPSCFRVRAGGKTYYGICIWDALGICAALGKDAVIDATCGDCGDAMSLEVRGGALTRSEGIVHFAIPAHHWWDNIGFT
jgi:hypothetical protein